MAGVDDGDRSRSVVRLAVSAVSPARESLSSVREALLREAARESEDRATVAAARLPETRVVCIASADEDRQKRWSLGLPEWLIPIRVSSAATLRSLLSTLQPSVIFLEINLPDLGGMRTVAQLSTANPTARIVVVTGHVSDGEALAAVRSGAWGYVHRDLDAAMVTRVVDAVLRDEHWMPRRVLSGLLLEGNSGIPRNIANPIRVPRTPSLSRREHEIAHFVLVGVSNKEIASRLAITEATVKAHLTVVFRKLGVTSRLQLGLLLAQQKGDGGGA